MLNTVIKFINVLLVIYIPLIVIVFTYKIIKLKTEIKDTNTNSIKLKIDGIVPSQYNTLRNFKSFDVSNSLSISNNKLLREAVSKNPKRK